MKEQSRPPVNPEEMPDAKPGRNGGVGHPFMLGRQRIRNKARRLGREVVHGQMEMPPAEPVVQPVTSPRAEPVVSIRKRRRIEM
ncbi:hypothetical protein PPMP20_15945 [Paraburkholderia phymatum]|uniref:Uncharacterized protein n=1 Tax=Paraburkholderia phymatum (strain DSM 17167 / CIP 108236 / LMG 21445 / STM815) TaxID=391038 RepID=B2JQ69_PARP8|nr:hypothetical protein [Paraburkholderia phymatum]ACC73410.1 hypothetical protein Bphy_4293 [Paraburkholderia phymatum STM815]